MITLLIVILLIIHFSSKEKEKSETQSSAKIVLKVVVSVSVAMGVIGILSQIMLFAGLVAFFSMFTDDYAEQPQFWVALGVFIFIPIMAILIIFKCIRDNHKKKYCIKDRNINYDYFKTVKGGINNEAMQYSMRSLYSNYSGENKKDRLEYLVGAKRLSKIESKRKRIVQKFNKKYNLNIYDSDIETIVSASYMDFGWEREVADMDKEYNSESQWYRTGPAIWLRAYLHAFSDHRITSDFMIQREIVLESFVNVFECVKPADCGSVGECIVKMNERFYTSFDDITFMIAYNFLELNGKHYELPKYKFDANTDGLSELINKYEKDSKEA